MTIQRLINRPCRLHLNTVVPAARDEMGDPVVNKDAGVLTVCDLQQDDASEDRSGDAGSQVTTHTLLLLPGERLDGWSELTIGPADADPETWDGIGDRYTLDGQPWQVRHPRMKTIHHIEATVRKVT